MEQKQPSETTVLVTGGSGFVGAYCLAQLLEKGYQVRTTLRSLSKQEEVLDMLREAGIGSFEKLSFVEADLTADKNWNRAVAGCDFVLHVASPIFLRLPKNEDEMIRPAVDGTLRVLRAARAAGVKRVVMTSNFGAVGYSHKDQNHVITEESWTDPNEKGLSAYNKSKVLAERAAWSFIEQQGNGLELAVINPMAIYGPSLGPKLSAGYGLLKGLLNGTMKQLPDIRLGIVDVRDVADLHLLAMTHPQAKSQRFLALAGGTLSLLEISRLLKERMPEVAQRASLKPASGRMLRLLAPFSKKVRSILPLVGVYRNASNEKARTVLGWNPRSNEEAILAAAESLLKHKHL